MGSLESTSEARSIQRATLFISMLVSFVFPFSASSLSIAVPFIGEELRIPAASLPWIISAMLLVNLSLNVPFGRFADLWGRRKLFTLGIGIFAVATFTAAFATSFWMLVVIRVFQGVGGAMFVSTNMAILVDVYPREQRGRALGLSLMCTYLGLSFGPVTGGLLVHYFSWNAVFFFTSSVALIVFIVSLVILMRMTKDSDVTRRQVVINPVSIVIYIVAMLVFMLGFITLGQGAFPLYCLALGSLLWFLFARHAMRAQNPVIKVGLFKNNRIFVVSNLAVMFNFAATAALAYILTIYLVFVRGFAPNIAGLALIAQPVMVSLISPLFGRISDKRSPFFLSSLGMAICAFSLLLFLFLDENTPLIIIIANLVLTGLGIGIFTTPNTNAVMSSIAPKDLAMANSINSTMRLIGQLSSMAIVTIITHFVIGDALISEAPMPDIMKTIHLVIVVLAVICVLGALLSLGRNKKPAKPAE